MPDPAGIYIERAIAWAMEKVASTAYALKCLGFVEDAFELANDIVLDGYGYAGEAAQAYGAADRGGVPPRGALAFYDCWGSIQGEHRNWGHVGLAIGEGRVIHAWGAVRIDGCLEVEALSGGGGWTSPRYIGWAPASQLLQGTASIRPVEDGDEPALWEMLYHAIHVPPGSERPPRDVVRRPELARYVQDWGRDGDMGYLAVEAATGQPAGAAWLRLLSGESKGYGYVDEATPELSIAVLPGFRGRGIGTLLLRRLLGMAAGRYPAVSLSVSAGNPARRLYERLGFEPVAEDGGSVTMRWVSAPS
jgi:GNAT superfamily N-acetyltransferase